MRKAWPCFPCLVILLVTLISAPSLYAQPAAFLERSAIVGVGNTIHITRVPTQDITGAVRYLDVDITLNVNEGGVIDAATVVSVESPQLQTKG